MTSWLGEARSREGGIQSPCALAWATAGLGSDVGAAVRPDCRKQWGRRRQPRPGLCFISLTSSSPVLCPLPALVPTSDTGPITEFRNLFQNVCPLCLEQSRAREQVARLAQRAELLLLLVACEEGVLRTGTLRRLGVLLGCCTACSQETQQLPLCPPFW